MKTFNDVKSFIDIKKKSNNAIVYDESFELAILCSRLLRKNPFEGREIIIRIHDIWELMPQNTHIIWNDLTESAGLYPYVQPLLLSNSALIRYEYHRSSSLEGVVLHEEQMIISQELLNKKSVVVGAPTSFGKSLLIEEIIATRQYKNIVIIQPTLALIDETRKKLFKYANEYKIILSTGQEPNNIGANIFLFTGERVVEYSHFKTLDFFVIDEFYKLSLERDDDRAIALNQAFGKLLSFTNKFYLLGPMIKSIPQKFKERFDLVWFPSEYATVAVDEINIDTTGNKREKDRIKKAKLNELLGNIEDQTIIYCSSPQKATELAIAFSKHLISSENDTKTIPTNGLDDIIEWLVENVNDKWSLIDALKHRIAFHHGALPRHLGSTIVERFNLLQIKWLFCTSTLIEGVNTSAKNVVLFDNEKGRKSIDYFDYKNIAGRSGRMKWHYVGNVIRFEPEPIQMELDVDIPLFNQLNAPLEILIGLNSNQIDDVALPRIEEFKRLPDELQILFKKNTGISIEGQQKIIDTIESDIKRYHSLLCWTTVPRTFDEMSAVIELCWLHLLGPGDQTYIPKIGRLSARWLASFAYSYVKYKSIAGVIKKYVNDKFWIDKIQDIQERNDIVTYSILHITRHWFDYKLPKWIIAISNIQEYVFTKNNLSCGNYAYTASSIENGFIHPNICALTEYDIPITALKKLSKYIDENKTPEDNLRTMKSLKIEQLHSLGLLKYEISKLLNNDR